MSFPEVNFILRRIVEAYGLLLMNPQESNEGIVIVSLGVTTF